MAQFSCDNVSFGCFSFEFISVNAAILIEMHRQIESLRQCEDEWAQQQQRLTLELHPISFLYSTQQLCATHLQWYSIYINNNSFCSKNLFCKHFVVWVSVVRVFASPTRITVHCAHRWCPDISSLRPAIELLPNSYCSATQNSTENRIRYTDERFYQFHHHSIHSFRSLTSTVIVGVGRILYWATNRSLSSNSACLRNDSILASRAQLSHTLK